MAQQCFINLLLLLLLLSDLISVKDEFFPVKGSGLRISRRQFRRIYAEEKGY
jgi:hypothetical protein